MITLKELEQYQRQQANAALAEDIDVAGARFRYVYELQRLQRHLRESKLVGVHGIPEAFPGTNVTTSPSGGRPRKPSEKILPTVEQAVVRFRYWGKRAAVATQVAQHLERLEAQFVDAVAAIQELPPRIEISPQYCRERLAHLIRHERERRRLRMGQFATRAGLHYKGVSKIERAGADSTLDTIARMVVGGFGIELYGDGMLSVAAQFMGRNMLPVTPAAVRYSVQSLNSQAEAETGQEGALYPPGRYLKGVREARGLSAGHVVQYSGHPLMHETYIRKYEAGLVPQLSRFLGWANGLRLSDHDAAVAWTLYMQRVQPMPLAAEDFSVGPASTTALTDAPELRELD